MLSFIETRDLVRVGFVLALGAGFFGTMLHLLQMLPHVH